VPLDLDDYLTPSPGVTCQAPQVLDLARRVAGKADDQGQAAIRLFEHVRDQIAYSPYVPFWAMEHYEAPVVLARGTGFCIQKAALLAALARAARIPARLGFADIENHLLGERFLNYLGANLMTFHCWAELWLSGRWIKATPSFERRLCQEQGWRLVEFDGQNNAMLPADDLAGRPHITYLRQHFTSAGVPLNEILAAWEKVYGPDRLAAWRADQEAGRG